MKVAPADLTLINSKELFKAITRLKKYLLVEPCTRKHIEYGYYADDVLAAINHAPTIDAVPVVRCEHCKEAVECQLYGEHCGLPAEKGIFCEVWQTVVDKNGYCYQGAKMDGGCEE